MTLRFYSNETEDVNPIAEIKDIDDTFGQRIDRIIMKYRDNSVSFSEEEPYLVKYGGISEVRIICGNVFIAKVPRDKFLTNKFFVDTFNFSYTEDLEKWLPQIKQVYKELNKIPRGNYSYWYMKS